MEKNSAFGRFASLRPAPGVIQAHLNTWDSWRTIFVSIEDDALTMSPALTSSGSNEIWVR